MNSMEERGEEEKQEKREEGCVSSIIYSLADPSPFYPCIDVSQQNKQKVALPLLFSLFSQTSGFSLSKSQQNVPTWMNYKDSMGHLGGPVG